MMSTSDVLSVINLRELDLNRIYEDYYWPIWVGISLLVVYAVAIVLEILAGPATHTDYTSLHQLAGLLFTAALLMTMFSAIGWLVLTLVKRM